ncbi:TNT domain-containing protein [Actinokineospora sp. G85]|uniref:TNT domain-containing protein n=1 Tax=Actinokineospora sp. G85 TaxID=3406626 RepID=UPI003C770619
MGIELPAALAGLAERVGAVWPQADEDGMRAAAGAWRDAGARVGALSGDADGAAHTTLSAFSGEAGDAAGRHWSAFVAPDSGHLTASAAHCQTHADRLDHAADRIGEAKVAIVRSLTELAKNTDAAHTAAAAGVVDALLGLATAERATAANIANITSTLLSSIAGGDGAYSDVVNANPGHQSGGQAGSGLPGLVNGLLGGLAGAPLLSNLVSGVRDSDLPLSAAPDQQGPGGLVPNLVAGVANALAGGGAHGPSGLVGGVLDAVGGVVETVAHTATGAVSAVVDTAAGVAHGVAGAVNHATGTQPGHGLLDPVVDVVDHTAGAVHDIGDQVAQQPAPQQPAPGHPAPGQHGPQSGGPAAGGGLVGGLPILGDIPSHIADAPTPPTGIPAVDDLPLHNGVQAASAAVLDVPAAAQPAPPAGSVGAAPGAQAGGAQLGGGSFAGNGPVGGGPSGGPVAGPPASAAAPLAARPAVPVAAVAPAVPPAAPVSGGPAPGRSDPGARVAASTGTTSGSGSLTGGRQVGADPLATGIDHKQGAAKQPQDKQPPAVKPHPDDDAIGGIVAVGPGGIQGALAGGAPADQDGARQGRLAELLGGRAPAADARPLGEGRGAQAGPPALPLPRAAGGQDKEAALLLVHLFPLGHLPVATSAPERQLDAPPREVDYAAGGRFAPADHPRSALIDLTTRVAEPAYGKPAAAGPLAAGHDPLGGRHERDWDRRFLVRPFDPNNLQATTEYAWPPGEIHPEGGVEAGIADLLPAGTVIDRFGTPEGRVFSADGTPFAQRSLPPALLAAGVHRYRVLRPTPVWRATSAPWFAQPGGGVRYRATQSAADLVALGYLLDITQTTRPAGATA